MNSEKKELTNTLGSKAFSKEFEKNEGRVINDKSRQREYQTFVNVKKIGKSEMKCIIYIKNRNFSFFFYVVKLS